MEGSERRNGRRSGSKRQVFWRTVILMAVCSAGFFIPLLVRLFQITIIDHDEYQARAARQRAATVQVSASRGEILDANGNVLAVSATVYNLILSPLDLVNSVSKAKFTKRSWPPGWKRLTPNMRCCAPESKRRMPRRCGSC